MLIDHFKSLDTLLVRNHHWWQFRPFHHVQSCWRQQCPELHQALETLSQDELGRLSRDPMARAEWLSPWIEDAGALVELCHLPRLQGAGLPFSAHQQRDIPGRKWEQISAFAGLVPAHVPVLEWCAGKGHLGRLLASNHSPAVTSLEWQASLCEQGQLLARRDGVAQQFRQVDVLNGNEALLEAGQHAVALHACGDLHVELLQQTAQQSVQGVTLAPCCYHQTRSELYRPLSRAAQASELRLDKTDLGLPSQSGGTGGARARREREQTLRWRLGFDSLQRVLRGDDSYLPVPPMPRALLRQSFADYVQWAAAQKNLTLPQWFDIAAYEAEGRQRFYRNQQMEFVQHLFLRPLEIWLALDRALFLEEQGYQVRLGEFCDSKTTPRNLLIQAQLNSETCSFEKSQQR